MQAMCIADLAKAPIVKEYLVSWRNTHTGATGNWVGSFCEILTAADQYRIQENFEWYEAREWYFGENERDEYGDIILTSRSEELADAVLALNRDGYVFEVTPLP